MYCDKCGNTLGEDSLFCTKCGKKTREDKKVEDRQQNEAVDVAEAEVEESTDSVPTNGVGQSDKGEKKKSNKLLIVAGVVVVAIAAIIVGTVFFISNQDDNPFTGEWSGIDSEMAFVHLDIRKDGTVTVTIVEPTATSEEDASTAEFEYDILDGVMTIFRDDFLDGQILAQVMDINELADKNPDVFDDSDRDSLAMRWNTYGSEIFRLVPAEEFSDLIREAPDASVSEEVVTEQEPVDDTSSNDSFTENNFTRYSYGFRNFGGMVIPLGVIGSHPVSTFDIRVEFRFASKTDFDVYRIDVIHPNYPEYDLETRIATGSVSADDETVRFNYEFITGTDYLDIEWEIGTYILSRFEYSYAILANYNYGNWGQLFIWSIREGFELDFDIYFAID